MAFVSTITDRARKVILPTLCIAVIAGFTWRTVQGKHGLRAYQSYGEQLVGLEAEARQMQQRRDELENQLRLLQSNAVDPDDLDELAHKKLNYMTPDEVMLDLPRPDIGK